MRHVLVCPAVMFAVLPGPEVVAWLFPACENWFRGRGVEASQFLLMVLTAVWFLVIVRRHFFRAIARRGMVCWECGNDLPEGTNTGFCAACGTAYNADDLAKRWDQPKGVFNRRYRDFSLEGKRFVGIIAVVAACWLFSMLCLWVLRNHQPSKNVPGAAISTAPPQAQIRWAVIISGAMVCSWIIVLALWIRFIVVARRIRKRARAIGGRMCSGCEHELAGIGDSGVCGECGRSFEIEQLRRMWGVK